MIKLFVTGGTFDKEYDELNGQLFFKHTHLPELFAMGRSKLQVDVETLMMKDSLEMTAMDREGIRKACELAATDKIVITHGTDTMEETASALQAAALGKTIVLTGAMIPYAFGSSDGLFNLGSALSFAQVLPAGVWVAMNGQIFEAGRVVKNRQSGIFERIG